MGSGPRAFARRQMRPSVNPLEGRVVLSTIHVNNPAQLVAAISSVNNTNGTNTLVLKSGNYFLTDQLKIQNAGSLVIQPAQAGATVSLTGSAVNRVLQIDSSNVTLQGINISGGSGVERGGGILAQNSALTLKNVRVFSNKVFQAGGGIFTVGGSLNMQSCSIMNNMATSSYESGGGGMVLWNTATTINSSLINENSVFAVDTATQGGQVRGSGGGILAAGGSLTINRSNMIGNTVYAVTTGTYSAAAGAAVSTWNTPVTTSGSTYSTNALTTVAFGTYQAEGSAFSTSGGSLAITNSAFASNLPGGWRSFYQTAGTPATITNSTIDGNKITGTKTLSS